VPTDIKAAYINMLLQVGFDTIDFGSFVSPKAIPQMRDTAEVLSKLDLSNTRIPNYWLSLLITEEQKKRRRTRR
jgi:isopropylmalate/homocitrate/citramalate synthase